FTFAVTAAATNGTPVRSLVVNWGDGSAPQNLGAVNGTVPASHIFLNVGSFLVTATLTDASGNTFSQSVPVTVIQTPPVSFQFTQSPVPGHVGAQTTINIQVNVPTGLFVQEMVVDFGDGSGTSNLGGTTSTQAAHTYTTTGTFTVTVTVTD